MQLCVMAFNKVLLRSSKVIWWPGMRVDWTSARRWVTSAGHWSRQAVNRWWDVKIAVSFSNFNFLFSGDGDGKAYIWDWKTTKLLSKWKAHDDVCIQAISSSALYSLLTLKCKTLLFTCSPHFTNIQTDPHLQVLWHPHEASKVATAGWDGVVKFWDWDSPNLFNGKSLCYKRGNLI